MVSFDEARRMILDSVHTLGTERVHLLEVAGRKELAAKIAADPKEVLELVNRADLARVKGIGEVYSNLLENAGVDTVLELSKRVPANLHAKLLEQTQTGDARRAPTLAQVEDWVKQAKELGRAVEY